MEINMYDPYYIIDPTKARDWLPSQGRSSSGKFAHNSTLTGAGDDNFGINSNYWARYARGSRDVLDTLRGEEFRFTVVPDETVFSWRMLCEMYEVAVKTLRAGQTEDEAQAAAWEYLRGVQRNTEVAVCPDGTEPSPIISGGEVLYSVFPSDMSDDAMPF